MDLTLVIMAAGMGSRFGGIKQMEPVGPHGELIIDYSVYDARKAGFTKVVFVIKKEIEAMFRERVFDRIKGQMDCALVFQETDALPSGLSCPKDRIKPWGTAHAVLMAKEEVKGAFAVINADDFYGADAFRLLAEYLHKLPPGSRHRYCMAGYALANTLSETGYVSRGVCQTDSLGRLISVIERAHIERDGQAIRYIENECAYTLVPDATVSMNCWGFTREFFDEIETQFPDFWAKNQENLAKAEFYLPSVVSGLLERQKAEVAVLKCGERWYGFTYQEDKAAVVSAVAQMIAERRYPERLWG